jgi:gliding motility-associated protein GldE
LETDTLLLSHSGSWGVQFHPFSNGVALSLLAVLVLVAISSLISGAETAYFSLSSFEKHKLKKTSKTDVWVLNHLENKEKLLATVLLSSTIINIGIIVLSVGVLRELVTFHRFVAIELIMQVAFISLVLLVFVGIAPKLYATRHALKLSRSMALPFVLLEKLLKPLIKPFLISSSFVNKRLQKHGNNFSIDEISQALHLTTEQELSEEKEILEGIVKFGNKNVSEIMKPRVDVVSLDIKTPFLPVLDLIVDSGFSRIPVYNGSFDNIKGILYIKDILPHSHKGGSFKWQSLIRPPFYVPETKKINSLLKEFQKNKVHLAVVIDEYGGTSGIVTLEDVLEEIVGEIVDEFDEEEHYYSKISANSFLFDGKTLLGDFFRIAKCDDTVFNGVKGDADTLAGLILELKGEIPALHEKTEYKQFIFTIEGVDDRRIKQIKVEIDRNYDER